MPATEAKSKPQRPAQTPVSPSSVPPNGSAGARMAWLTIRGAAENNLKNIDVGFPLGRFTCVTGVSGSGKSSLVNDILYAGLAVQLNGATAIEVGAHRKIDGVENLDKVIAIDQTPIGRTPRSNPATYIKLFDEIRDMFAKLPDAKLRGYKPGRFSFNVATGPKNGGRCEACEGNGANKIEMDFLADVWVTCPVCEGRRFNRETLQVHFKGKSIADVLEMDVQQALQHFDNVPRIRGMVQTLHDVGLDYIKLGQSSTTLSGGEAQRIKLARELVKKPTGRTLYVLDEPTTGLHFEDVRKLLAVLHGFVDTGNTVVVIEHNLDVIKTADWIIDLGPEGGAGGGRIIAEGTPEEIAAVEESETGKALADVLNEEFVSGQELEATGQGNASARAGIDSKSRTKPARTPAGVHTAITVRGAKQHNLRDISVSFPRDQITVCTGVSGSGKTSFAIDTVFTEGYRRYVESLSAYARQFLGQMAKPRVDHVEGLSPAICIEQKSASKSPRSTVGTVTEIYDYMRVLWARIGERYCPQCQTPIGTQTADEITARVMALRDGAPIILLAPMALGDGESYATLFNRLKASGYTRVRIDGDIQQTAHATTLDAKRKHRVEVVVDRTVVRAKSRGRIAESVEHALALGNGLMTLVIEDHEEHAAADDPPEPVEGVVIAAESGGADPQTLQTTSDVSTTGDASPENPAHTRPEPRTQREFLFSQKLACAGCGTSYEELGPHHLSFNSPLGWCDTCEGLGVQRGAPASEIIRKPSKSLFDGAIAGWSHIDRRSEFGRMLVALCDQLGVSPDAPLAKWTVSQRNALMFGAGADGERSRGGEAERARREGGGATDSWMSADGGLKHVRFQWRGFFPTIDAATRHSFTMRMRLHSIVSDIPCATCRGGRLRSDSAAIRVGGKTIGEICDVPLDQVAAFFDGLSLDATQKRIAGELLKEIRDRLQFLIDVGLEYLTLHRSAPTLSGGEAQRIRLASQIGSGLSGVLYVLDEPTIGLHPRDNTRLVRALTKLRDLGNTLLMVEHDREVIASADRVIDFGPRAGAFGGRVVWEGTPAEFARSVPAATADPVSESLTRGYLAGELSIAIPANRRPIPAPPAAESHERIQFVPDPGERRPRASSAPTSAAATLPWLVIRSARQNNLRSVDVPFPLGRLVCVTGVSGSGKSSLVNDILWPVLANKLQRANHTIGDHDGIDIIVDGKSHATKGKNPGDMGARELVRFVDKVINVDQSPLGSTPTSNPITYTGGFDLIRELFARLPDSKVHGYNANRFSFNRPGGRCEACEGYGQKKIEMHFMPDVWVECEVCHGRRYNPETLEVKFKGRTISEVLDMRIAAALELFENVPKVRRILQTIADVGLDYVQLGQPAPTLSGGEAQRVKLAAELAKPQTGKTLYVLDEPTTGLHFEDVRKLLTVLHRLTDLGNTLIVVEHNLDVIKSADWIIDLGPEAGGGGGEIVAMGTPEAIVAAHAKNGKPARSVSHTAAALQNALATGIYEQRAVYDPVEHARREAEIEKSRLGEVGKNVKMPWQIDGRKWHLSQRTSREGKPTKWIPDALEFVIELVESQDGFEPTNWNDRASIEITAPRAETWFLHALTGGEWLIEFYFRVPPGSFDGGKLNRQLGLKTLDEREDIQAYGNWPRVDVRSRADGLDAIAIYVHDRDEVDTPAFRKFVKDAARAYRKAVAQT